MISPSCVTILKLCKFSFETLIAVSILSTITVLPNKLNIICSYFLLYFIKSDATPIIPLLFPLILSIFFPFIEVIGKKEALPILFFLKCSTNFFASCSVSVTIFCNAIPKLISIAVCKFSGTSIRLANTPSTPFFNATLLSQSFNNVFTLFV